MTARRGSAGTEARDFAGKRSASYAGKQRRPRHDRKAAARALAQLEALFGPPPVVHRRGRP